MGDDRWSVPRVSGGRAIIFGMRYRYEDLGDREFQQLVQALLAASFGPTMRAMPLGKADGGRDALHNTAVYQVKFTSAPDKISDPVDWLLAALKGEAKKIRLLVERGVRSYYLVTNVGGTGKLDTGTIDRLDRELAVLANDLSIPITVWWRDDVDARMSAAPSTALRPFIRALPPDQILALTRLDPIPGEIPRQVPAVPADFTGRRPELADLVNRCTAEAAVSPLVISGMAGVGKSALALRLAHELATQYPDGQLYSAMRGPRGSITAAVTLARFLRALGTPADAVPADLAEQAAVYRSRLVGKRVLVVLDEADSARQIEPLLPGDPSCLVVVTSRNPLPALPSGLSYPLGLLNPAESLELLSRIAGADRVSGDPEAGERIVELCGRLPLALRIAAARLRSRTDWTPGHLVVRLSDIRRRLRELRAGDLDVRASFELSYQDLPAAAARLFRRLAVAPGVTFSAELAAVLSGTAQPDTDELLDRLVLDQMLQPSGAPDQYSRHQLVWVFAHEIGRAHV